MLTYLKRQTDLITLIFWIIIVIFYMDLGGIIQSSDGEMNILAIPSQFVITLMAYVFFYLRYAKSNYNYTNKRFIDYYTLIIIIWYAYYLIWYYWLNNPYFPGFIRLLARNTRMLMQGLIVFPIIYFATNNLYDFIKILTWSTFSIILLFVITLLTGIPFIAINTEPRVFINLNRHFLLGEGLLAFSLPIALSYSMMKFKSDKLTIWSGAMVILYYCLTLTRANIVGIIEHIFIISFIVNYIHSKKIHKMFQRIMDIRYSAAIMVAIISLWLLFPLYLNSLGPIAKNTISVFTGWETDLEIVDARLSLTQKVGIVNAIKENMWLGTGYDPAWFSGGGGKDQWEGNDYRFLGSFAMYGIVGLLVFLPFYLLAIKIISKILKLIRGNYKLINNNQLVFHLPTIVGIAAASEIIKNIIEYPNWFEPIAASSESPILFIYFGLLLGSLNLIQKKIVNISRNSKRNLRIKANKLIKIRLYIY